MVLHFVAVQNAKFGSVASFMRVCLCHCVYACACVSAGVCVCRGGGGICVCFCLKETCMLKLPVRMCMYVYVD